MTERGDVAGTLSADPTNGHLAEQRGEKISTEEKAYCLNFNKNRRILPKIIGNEHRTVVGSLRGKGADVEGGGEVLPPAVIFGRWLRGGERHNEWETVQIAGVISGVRTD